jgi:hypothetical protein
MGICQYYVEELKKYEMQTLQIRDINTREQNDISR